MPAVARTRDHNNRTIPMRADQLTARHRLLVEYMVHGLPHATLCERTTIVDGFDPETGTPITRHPRVGEQLTLEAAAVVLHIKRRNARSLSRQAPFERLLAAETAAMRSGARPRAMARMIDLVDQPGQGKAADRKVQLAAAQAVLGESPGLVNVQVNNSTTIVAGIVVRRFEPRHDDDRTIDHEAA